MRIWLTKIVHILKFGPFDRSCCKPFQTLWGDDRAAIVSNFSRSEPVILLIFADLSKMTWRQNKSTNQRALYPDDDVKKSSPSEKKEKKHKLNA